MKFSQLFQSFINTGHRPATAQETSALLDESRACVLDITRRIETGEIALAESAASAPAPAATAKPKGGGVVFARTGNPLLKGAAGATASKLIARKGSIFDREKPAAQAPAKTAAAAPAKASPVAAKSAASPAPSAAPTAKPQPTGIERVKAACAAKPKPSAVAIPESVKSLTGLAKVTAIFKAQSTTR